MQNELSQAMLELEDKECEKAVIGALIAYPSCYYEIGDLLKSDEFTDPKCRAIYDAVSQMIFDGQDIDVYTLSSYMIQHPAKGVTVEFYDITEISQSVATSATAYNNAANLNDLWQRRQVLLNLYRLAEGATDRTRDISTAISDAADKIQSLS